MCAKCLFLRGCYSRIYYDDTPMKAEIVVEAATPDDAISLAKLYWQDGPRALLVPGSEDEGAACDWQPSAEPVPQSQAD